MVRRLPVVPRRAGHRNWYVWADPKPDGSPPNNWVSSFGGPAWTLDDAPASTTCTTTCASSPTSTGGTTRSGAAFDDIMRLWLDRGVAGFRIDVCNMIIKDALLRDNPPATEDDTFDEQLFGQRSVYNANRPEVHEVLRRWRRLADALPGRRAGGRDAGGRSSRPWPPTTARATTSCTWPSTSRSSARRWRPTPCAPSSRRSRRPCPPRRGRCGPGRTTTCPGSPPGGPAAMPAKARVALLMLLCLRGTPGPLPGRRDRPGGHRRSPRADAGPARRRSTGRPTPDATPCGRPCPGATDPAAGSPSPGCEPWLPFGDLAAGNVEAQRDDPDSMLNLDPRPHRPAPDARRICRSGAYSRCRPPRGRGPGAAVSGTVVVANMSDGDGRVEGVSGTMSARHRPPPRRGAGRRGLRLQGWEAVVVERGPSRL